MRRLACQILMLLVLLLLGGSARALRAQEVGEQLADRAPRFLLASAVGAKPAAVDAASVPALRQRISVDLDGVTLEQALTTITRDAGLRLVYSKGVVPLENRVTLGASNITVAGALSEVLMGSGVDVLLTGKGQAVLVKRAPALPAALAPGAIVGRVTDSKTQTALAGATVLVLGTNRGATTGSDGRYRIADVAPGTYTVRARYIGYAPGTASVTVSADQQATADLALEKSAQRLDEVVTTGTLVPTEVKALPSPISVISSDQIERENIQGVAELFRGDIPGAVAWDRGQINWAPIINTRGATSVELLGVLKTYIDGIEVTDPSYIGGIDPNSIERVEVIRGPQASTLYGSQALGGVMQIFTKKGDYASGVHGSAKVSGGVMQSQWLGGKPATPVQDYAVSLTGGSPSASFNIGASRLQSGEWLAGASQRNNSIYASVSGTAGRLIAELSGRYYNISQGLAEPPIFLGFADKFPAILNIEKFDILIHQGSYALALQYAATSRWKHRLDLGYDQLVNEDFGTKPAVGDSLIDVDHTNSSKLSFHYTSTLEVPLARAFVATAIAGVEHSEYLSTSVTFRAPDPQSPAAPGQLQDGRRSVVHNTGVFAQGMLGVADALFVTAGLRAESNQNFGADYGLSWAPRVGLSYVRSAGGVSLKARASYGKAIRPPSLRSRLGELSDSRQVLPNLTLGPEAQSGVDGGLDIDFGRQASLGVTYYNQTASDLIDQAPIDLAATPPQYQNQNIGKIKNTGWEFEGRLAPTPALEVTGTYSITRSTVQTLSPAYTGDLLPGDRLTGIPRSSAGATVSYRLPRTLFSVGLTYIGSWTEQDFVALYTDLFAGVEKPGRSYWIDYPSVMKYSFSVSQDLGRRLTAFAQVRNLSNSYRFERDNAEAAPGRTTVAGIRARF